MCALGRTPPGRTPPGRILALTDLGFELLGLGILASRLVARMLWRCEGYSLAIQMCLTYITFQFFRFCYRL